ncbi:hypothetical protein MEQU1_002448 [Malassezia equina]|uniref:Transcription initiation factor TFIID subunit 4 n=1 Tax=Malassezia equina TaxID=1381935 RepID=A0AAF0IZ94_9BASI|nr:hypothetical protein MEQU1_002448 [Malassezia equina]
MEKRQSPSGARDESAQAKRIKMESSTEELKAPGTESERTSPLPAGNDRNVPRVAESPLASAMSNLDRLANLAAQRTETPSTNPLLFRPDNLLLNTPTQGGNVSSALPLSVQRLQAVRNAQAGASGAVGSSPVLSTGVNAAPGLMGTNDASAASGGSSSYDQLVDVMGYSGVDLRAEEAFIQRSGSLWDDAQAASAISTAGMAHGLYLNVYPLSSMVHRIAKQYGLKVDAATLDYLSIATRMRFRNLLESMVRASRHRAWSSHQRRPPLHPGTNPDGTRKPVYHEEMLSNPTKQLAAIEKAERIEEGNWRRMRLEREEMEAAALEAGGDDGSSKNKKRPSMSSRNLSEDVRKRLADSTAMRHLGANNVTSKYSWLQSPGMRSAPRARDSDAAPNDSPSQKSSSLPKPKFAPSASLRSSASQAAHAGAWSDVATRQAAQREQERVARARVTLHDALAALEREQAGGAGHGAGRRALYLAQAYGHGRGSL